MQFLGKILEEKWKKSVLSFVTFSTAPVGIQMSGILSSHLGIEWELRTEDGRAVSFGNFGDYCHGILYGMKIRDFSSERRK